MYIYIYIYIYRWEKQNVPNHQTAPRFLLASAAADCMSTPNMEATYVSSRCKALSVVGHGPIWKFRQQQIPSGKLT